VEGSRSGLLSIDAQEMPAEPAVATANTVVGANIQLGREPRITLRGGAIRHWHP
jgi:hypothetical protein